MSPDFAAIWEQLLSLKQCVTGKHQLVCIAEQSHCVSVTRDLNTLENWQAMVSTQPMQLEKHDEFTLFKQAAFLYLRRDLSHEIRQFYRLYLPLACILITKPATPFVMVHVAQSLDGKVCTLNGASKWIGNEQNLIHAHRIRALVDGVAVGGNTLRAEQPALTVRHVPGDNPARLIFSNCASSLAKMPTFPHINTIVICHTEKAADINIALNNRRDIQLLTYPKQLTEQQDPMVANTVAIKQTLSQKLQQFGIHSVMVEGGPGLISWLIKAGIVDMLQVHIAPLLFGSGKSLAEFGSIADVSQAIHLQSPYYCTMGDAMMMTAELAPRDQEQNH